MRYNFAAMLIIAVLLSGCAGNKMVEYTTSAVHARESEYPPGYTLIYALPKTTIRVTVETTRVTTIKGPYFQYADKYLGITDAPSRDEVEWIISGVSTSNYQESDPDHFYMLKTNNRHVTNFFKLSDEGFILPVNHKQIPDLDDLTHSLTPEYKSPFFTDLSMNPRVVEESRTVMRMVRQDDAFVNVPVMERQSVTRSLEARAAEVADLIFELRSNRFKLLSGDLDLFPDGKALEVIVEEFTRLENEYLSLFTGKVFKTVKEYSFEYTPDKDAIADNTEYGTLFRFSDTEGVLPNDNISGRPITLEIEGQQKTRSLDRIKPSTNPDRPGTGTLFYRIPDIAKVSLKDGNSVISSVRIPVSQYGSVVTLPADFLWD